MAAGGSVQAWVMIYSVKFMLGAAQGRFLRLHLVIWCRLLEKTQDTEGILKAVFHAGSFVSSCL